MAADPHEAEHEAPPATPMLRLDIKSPSFDRPLSMDADGSWTIRELKEHISQAAQTARPAPHAWPASHGIRCIHRGRILNDEIRLGTLEPGESLLSMHIVVQPEAWRPWETATPVEVPTEAPAEAPTEAPTKGPEAPSTLPAEAPPYAAFFESMPTKDENAIAHALFFTHAAYAASLAELSPHLPEKRLPRVPIPTMWPDNTTQQDADVRSSAVTLIERHVMHWEPWRDVCAKAPQAMSTPVAQYDHLMLQGLPYLLCTYKAAPPEAVTQALVAQLLERMAHLHDAWVELACRHIDRRPAPAPGPMPVPTDLLTWADAGAILGSTAAMGWRLLLLHVAITDSLPGIWNTIGIIAEWLFLVWHAYSALQRRWRERFAAHVGTPAPSPSPAQTAASEALAEAPDALEMPYLPHRQPQGNRNQLHYWVQRVAWLGLEEEEVAMGFGHVPPSTPLRITWIPTRAYATTRPAPLQRPWWLRYIVLPMVLFFVTLIPAVTECRNDALSLRKDAILALKTKWDEFRDKPSTPSDARPPALLLHPYSLNVLANASHR
ncbi:hypothetical protein MNAN1_000562 [Malassezia nana]|uniref:Ubiquitin-like domain-containing protein n=1 Tax=Malassezia nana TaxID=180528 RepID=A0AAF0J160_9BASI|nr:hypothetical protein MNAN1_000562 [Malassezia nana]